MTWATKMRHGPVAMTQSSSLRRAETRQRRLLKKAPYPRSAVKSSSLTGL